MKNNNFIPAFVLSGLSLLLSPEAVHAQVAAGDIVTINSRSSSDDILAAVNQLAQDQLHGNLTANDQSTRQFLKNPPAETHHALIDAWLHLSQGQGNDQAQSRTGKNLIQHCLWLNLSVEDTPYLLGRDNLPGIAMEIIRQRRLTDAPAVTAFLLTTLHQAQLTTPILEGDSVWWGIGGVLSDNHDSRVSSAFSDLVTKMTADVHPDDAKIRFIYMLVSMVTAPRNPNARLLPPCLSVLITSYDKTKSSPILPLIGRALRFHPELRTDTSFAIIALPYLKNPSEKVGSERENSISLAYLGSPDGFVKAMDNHFHPPGNPRPNEIANLQEVETDLLYTVLYSGPGDKLDALKDHANAAIYKNGYWILTMPGFPMPSIPHDDSNTSRLTPTSSGPDILAESNELGRNRGANNTNAPGYSPEPERAFLQQIEGRDHKMLIDAFVGQVGDEGKDRGVLFRCLRRILDSADLPHLTQAASDPRLAGTEIARRLKQISREILARPLKQMPNSQTDPSVEPATSTPSNKEPAIPAIPPPAPSGPASLPVGVAETSQVPVSSAPFPCTIVSVVPLEAMGPDGTMLSVTKATIGKSYQCLRIEGGMAVLQDENLHLFKIRAAAIGQTSK